MNDRNIVVRSTRKFETIKIGFRAEKNADSALLHFACPDAYSPIEMHLTLGQSEGARWLLGQSLSMTHELAAKTLREARSEQRHGGDNVSGDVDYNTEQMLAPIVLAHLLKPVNFSFANLQPHTIDTLKILALDHQTSDINLFKQPQAA
jgi:hypothetical protein